MQAQDHDPYGHVIAVRDSATSSPYWRLTDVDSAGRVRQELFGNDAITERSYFADKQSLKSIVTHHGGAKVQDLAYDYDARLDLKSPTTESSAFPTTTAFCPGSDQPRGKGTQDE